MVTISERREHYNIIVEATAGDIIEPLDISGATHIIWESHVDAYKIRRSQARRQYLRIISSCRELGMIN